MKSLVDCFREDKEILRSDLKAVADNPAKIVELVQYEIGKLAAINGEYLSQLNQLQTNIAIEQSQPRIALALLTVLSMSLGDPSKLQQVQQLHASKDDPNEPKSPDSDFAKMVTPVGAGVAVASAAGFVGLAIPQIGILASAAVVSTTLLGFLVEIFLPSISVKEKAKGAQEETQIVTKNTTQKVDIERLLFEIEQQLNAIDRDVAKYGGRKETTPLPPNLEDHKDIVDFFQKFIGDANYELSQLPKLTKNRLEEALDVLRRHGIKVKFYDQNMQKIDNNIETEDMFEFEKRSIDLNIKDYVTQKPALVKDGKVIRVGLVIEPVSDE